MKDVDSLRADVISGLEEVGEMSPKGPDDQIVPEDVQDKMKQRLQEILNQVEE